MRLEWQLLGALAMLMIEVSYLPQILKLYRIKNADDFSIMFPLLNAGGRGLGVVYTGLNGDLVIALGFVLGILLRLTLLVQVWYYRRLKQQAAAPSFPTGNKMPASSFWLQVQQQFWPQTHSAPTVSPILSSPPSPELLLQPALCYTELSRTERHRSSPDHDRL